MDQNLKEKKIDGRTMQKDQPTSLTTFISEKSFSKSDSKK